MKVKIWNDFCSGRINIVFYEESYGKRRVMQFKDEPEIITVEDGVEIKPTLSLVGLDDTACNLANELSRFNIRTDNDHKIQGILEAQKYHLEDLRKLLKLPEEK